MSFLNLNLQQCFSDTWPSLWIKALWMCVCQSVSAGSDWVYLEVVLDVAVGVFGDVEEDEEVLAEVVSHGLDPRHTVLRQTELHHFRRRRARRLNELRRRRKSGTEEMITSTVYYPTIKSQTTCQLSAHRRKLTLWCMRETETAPSAAFRWHFKKSSIKNWLWDTLQALIQSKK